MSEALEPMADLEALAVEVEAVDAEPTERRPNTYLAPHQFDFVAMAMENGVPTEDIARAVQCEPDYIKRLARRGNESFNKVRDRYREQLLNATVAWRYKLARLLDLGYIAIENGLTQTRDPELACEQAWKVLEAVVPASSPKAAAVAPGIQVNFGANAQIQTELSAMFKGVMGSFEVLKGVLTTEPDRHIKQGADAIIQLGIPDREAVDVPLIGQDFSTNGSGNGGSPIASSSSGETKQPDAQGSGQ